MSDRFGIDPEIKNVSDGGTNERMTIPRPGIINR